MKNKPIDTAVCHVELNHIGPGLSRALKTTLAIFREVCKFIGGVIEENWDDISAISGSQEKLTFVEGLIHETKGNVPKYPEFDAKFYKFPSYYRRSAINCCIGQASSYYTRLAEYQERRKSAIDNGKRFKENPPVLNWETNACPSMYKKEMYYVDGKTIYIKLFIRNTWDWVKVSAPSRDLKDLAGKSAMGTLKSPMLTYKYHKFYLIFPIKYHVANFPKTKLSERRMMGIDLGVNRGAALNIMDSSGTILARFFDPFTRERDQMNHLINKIRKIQKQSGNGSSLAAIYTKLDGVKNNYVRQLSRWIVNLAIQYDVYGIVLEHLGKMKGSKSARIHHWCKCRIRDLVKGMALRNGIRVFLINPKNTSALAYDGSGEVVRGEYLSANGETKYNYSVCTFPSGKQYNCDLSASYNINARYFLREFQKSMDETRWSELTAKVPELSKRTMCTLSTLWALNKALAA